MYNSETLHCNLDFAWILRSVLRMCNFPLLVAFTLPWHLGKYILAQAFTLPWHLGKYILAQWPQGVLVLHTGTQDL